MSDIEKPDLPAPKKRQSASLKAKRAKARAALLGGTGDMKPKGKPGRKGIEKPDLPAPKAVACVYQVTLQARHDEWIRLVAAQHGRTVEDMIQVFVRRAYADDPTRGGTVALGVGSSVPGTFKG